jgi:hypothetical protein
MEGLLEGEFDGLRLGDSDGLVLGAALGGSDGELRSDGLWLGEVLG